MYQLGVGAAGRVGLGGQGCVSQLWSPNLALFRLDAVHWEVGAVLVCSWSCVSWLFASWSVWCRVFPLAFGFVSLVHVVDVFF